MLKVSDTKEYYLIENREDVEEMLEVLKDPEVDIVAYDTETTGLNVRKDKVIGFSFSYQEGQGFYFPIFTYEISEDGGKLEPYGLDFSEILEVLSTKQLVMHNASFDTRISLNDLKVDLLTGLHSDTVMMRHTLKEDGPFGLKEIALELAMSLGFGKDDIANQEQLDLEESVKSRGGSWKKSEKDIYMAELNVLAKYAVADTDITLRLFNHFEKELKKENLHKFFYEEEVMPLLKEVTIPMEHYGIPLDVKKTLRLKEEILKDIEKLETSVLNQIQKSKEFDQFLKYRIRDEVKVSPSGSFAQAVVEFYSLPLPKSASGKFSITAKNISKLEDSPAKRFLSGEVDTLPEPDVFQICKNILTKQGPLININSKKQLGTLVFDVLNINFITKTPKGSPQFNEEFVEYLADNNLVSWASDLRVYNKLNKIYGSSYDRFLQEQEDGVFYPYYKQHGTTSGRYSSNIQQLPKPIESGEDHPLVEKYTNEIRSLFVPKKGHVFIDDDYESLEPRCFADDCGDTPLIEIFEKGEDFYSKIVLMAQNVKGVVADKKADNYLGKLYPSMRQNGKSYSLGIRYGMKSGKLAKTLNISKELAQDIIDGYFEAFPKLKKSMDDYIESVKKKGFVVNSFGRVRHLDEARKIYKKFGESILDYSKLGLLSKKFGIPYQDMKDISRTFNNLINNALNFPIQSKAASLVNRAAIAMSEKFVELELDAYVVAQIHDQIVVSCDENIKDTVAEIVQNCMENTNKLSMKLIAKPEFCYNLKDGH